MALACAKVKDQAFVTLVTNDSDEHGACKFGENESGALTLGYSLRRAGTTRSLVCLVTKNVSPSTRTRLARLYDLVEVDVPPGPINLLNALAKFHCWKLTQFSKCVFLAPNTLVLQDIDDLFKREEFSAGVYVRSQKVFNSGVFVFKPSQETYENLLKVASMNKNEQTDDQKLLNEYFSDGWAGNAKFHLRNPYNALCEAFTNKSLVKHYLANTEDAKVIHFIGRQKPWHGIFRPDTGLVSCPKDSGLWDVTLQRPVILWHKNFYQAKKYVENPPQERAADKDVEAKKSARQIEMKMPAEEHPPACSQLTKDVEAKKPVRKIKKIMARAQVKDQAFVTLVVDTSSGVGALTLGYSLRRTGTTKLLVCMVTKNVSPITRTRLARLYALVEVDASLCRVDHWDDLAKFQCWKLTQFSKCVFMSPNTLVGQNIDDLFNREEFSAAARTEMNCLDSGVFVFKPSEETFRRLMELGSNSDYKNLDGDDQSILNDFFTDWRNDKKFQLPISYNFLSRAFTSLLLIKNFNKEIEKVKVVQFTGVHKPWHGIYRPNTESVDRPKDSQLHVLPKFVNLWWEIYARDANLGKNYLKVEKQAFVTLVTDDDDEKRALTLGYSLWRTGTTKLLVCMVTYNVSPSTRSELARIYELEQANLHWGNDSFLRKCECWRLTQFSKCVFLAPNTLVGQNIDDLFEREEFSAVPSAIMDCLDSGVFVFKPSEETYKLLMELGSYHKTLDGDDERLLDDFFTDWRKDLKFQLPISYNCLSEPHVKYVIRDNKEVKVIQFTEIHKPWDMSPDMELADSPGDFISQFVKLWLEIYAHDANFGKNDDMEFTSDKERQCKDAKAKKLARKGKYAKINIATDDDDDDD